MNGPYFSNITFRTLDATKLDYPPNSFDCIFFIWLLAYLTDDEVKKCTYMLLKYVDNNCMLKRVIISADFTYDTGCFVLVDSCFSVKLSSRVLVLATLPAMQENTDQ